MNGVSLLSSIMENAGSAKCPPPNGGWILQRVRIVFRDIPDAVPPDPQGVEAGTCRLLMCLHGQLPADPQGPDQGAAAVLHAGHCRLQYHPRHCACRHCTRPHPAQVLELACPAADLVRLLGDTPAGRALDAAAAWGHPLRIERPMPSSLHQALICLRKDSAEAASIAAPLVLARAMEMIWQFTRNPHQANPARVPETTRRAVEKARVLLEADLADPPSLETLAGSVGMSLSKLKQVFPLVCGQPPYAYLRQVRLERALHLLGDHGLSVTETALEVGYTNLSHFTKAFAARFGFNPSQVQRGGLVSASE